MLPGIFKCIPGERIFAGFACWDFYFVVDDIISFSLMPPQRTSGPKSEVVLLSCSARVMISGVLYFSLSFVMEHGEDLCGACALDCHSS